MKTAIGLCSLLLLTAFAKTYAQFRVYGGPQLSTVQYSIRDVSQAAQSKTGFMAGVGLQSWIEGPAYFAPQIYYSQKGYKVTFDRPASPPDSGAKNNDVTARFVGISPMVQFNFSKKPSYAFIRIGPAFEFAVSGTENYDSTNNKHVSRSMPFAFDAYSFATLSANVQLGFQHKSGFLFFVHYHYGLSSLNNADYGPAIFLREAGASIGWRLGKKR